MATYFTSDLHFRHKNIVKFTNRSEETTSELHDYWLIDLWNSQVKASDEVYVLGDLSFAGYNTTASIVLQLNGKIIVIKGNHDDRRTLDRLSENYLIHAWYDYKELKINEVKICMMHFPIACWNEQGRGSIHFHGHSHGSYKSEGRILDVGIDSSYNIFGKHRLFELNEAIGIAGSKAVLVKDHHKEIN